MAWIKEINKEESKLLKQIYEGAEGRTKEPTANALKVHSIRPKVLDIHMKFYEKSCSMKETYRDNSGK